MYGKYMIFFIFKNHLKKYGKYVITVMRADDNYPQYKHTYWGQWPLQRDGKRVQEGGKRRAEKVEIGR